MANHLRNVCGYEFESHCSHGVWNVSEKDLGNGRGGGEHSNTYVIKVALSKVIPGMSAQVEFGSTLGMAVGLTWGLSLRSGKAIQCGAKWAKRRREGDKHAMTV